MKYFIIFFPFLLISIFCISYSLGIPVLNTIPTNVKNVDNEKNLEVEKNLKNENTEQHTEPNDINESYKNYFKNFDIIVDSLFGFSFSGVPREPFKSMIAALSESDTDVLSVDVPSGEFQPFFIMMFFYYVFLLCFFTLSFYYRVFLL